MNILEVVAIMDLMPMKDELTEEYKNGYYHKKLRTKHKCVKSILNDQVFELNVKI